MKYNYPKAIKKLRAKLDLSQEELAKLLNVSLYLLIDGKQESTSQQLSLKKDLATFLTKTISFLRRINNHGNKKEKKQKPLEQVLMDSCNKLRSNMSGINYMYFVMGLL